LRLEVPVGRPGVQVKVSIEAVESSDRSDTPPDPKHVELIRRLFGSIDDPTFRRPDQPPAETRVEFD